MSSRVRSIIVVVLAAFGLLAAACGSSAPAVDTSVDAGSASEADSTAENADVSGQTESADGAVGQESLDETEPDEVADPDEPAMAAASPIGAFFAEDGGFTAALDEYRLRVEEQIVRCMAEQGFEFVASGDGGRNPVQERQNELSERAWTAEYGYGISTSFDSVAAQRAGNPNAEILFSLSAAEREAWTETLLGPGNDLGDVGNNEIPLDERGCIGSSIIATRRSTTPTR